MDLSIITVNTNDKEKLIPQIQSVRDSLDGSITVQQIISDNGSTDGSIDAIKKQFPDVVIVENGGNVGFGAANNRGLEQATGRYILYLNPDMRVLPGTLETMVKYMDEHPTVGIASCKLIDQQGNIQPDALPRRFPGLIDQLAIVLKIAKVMPSVLSRYLYKGFDPEQEQAVDSVRGSFMLTRKEITDKLGWGFDPRYFLWFEDVDTCRETKRLGYDIMYTPTAQCVDYVGQTFKRKPMLQKQIWFTTSMVQYFKKWDPVYMWLPIAIARPIGIVFAALYDVCILRIRNWLS
jgi:GT2 family glycosyltransferase